MPDPFISFLEKPTGQTFADLRGVVVEAPEYDFYAGDLDRFEQLAADGQFDAVTEQFSAAMPNWLLSPRVHQLVARAAEQTGDVELAQRENYLVKACLRGLTESGDGTAARPYLVTHVSDEYDVLEALEKESARHRQVSNDRGVFDVIECADGTTLWFDINPSLKTQSLS